MTCTLPCITRVQQRFTCARWSLTTAGPDVPEFESQRKNERVMSVVLTRQGDMAAVCDGTRATRTHDHREISPHPSRYWAPLSTRYMELLACTRAHVFSSGASTVDDHSGWATGIQCHQHCRSSSHDGPCTSRRTVDDGTVRRKPGNSLETRALSKQAPAMRTSCPSNNNQQRVSHHHK